MVLDVVTRDLEGRALQGLERPVNVNGCFMEAVVAMWFSRQSEATPGRS